MSRKITGKINEIKIINSQFFHPFKALLWILEVEE